MLNEWTDGMIRDYYDTHWDATIYKVCALSGRSKYDVVNALMACGAVDYALTAMEESE